MHKELKSIVIVTRSMFAGGAERVIAQLANDLVRRHGIQCRIITMDNENVLYDLDNRIEIEPIGQKHRSKLVDKYARYRKLRVQIDRIKPDLVLSMPEDIGVYVGLALIGSTYPLIVSERNNPWVMPDKKLTRMLRTLIYPYVDGVVFQTEMAKSFFKEKIQQKGVVLDNPVDDSRIPARYVGKRNRKIVSAGRLCKQKNFPMLIKAFSEFEKKFPEYTLTIYGEGNERGNLEKLVAELEISDKVYMPGRMENLLELMRDASMFVLTSDYEGVPNVLIEALCMGLPSISTDCPPGGPRKLIEDQVNGLLVPVNDVRRLTESMFELTDENTSVAVSNEAFKIREYLTDEKVFDDWFEYLQLVHDKSIKIRR